MILKKSHPDFSQNIRKHANKMCFQLFKKDFKLLIETVISLFKPCTYAYSESASWKNQRGFVSSWKKDISLAIFFWIWLHYVQWSWYSDTF